MPAPKVLAWNSHLAKNPVGAEYVLVDKFPGVSLQSVWDNLSYDDIHNLCSQLARYQGNLLSKSFRQIGALYYADQAGPTSAGPLTYIDREVKEMMDPRFTIGPVTDQKWVLAGRCKLECDRGPWSSTLDFLKAIVYHELKAVETSPQVVQSFDVLRGPGAYDPTKEKKQLVGQMYLQGLEHITPLHSPLDTFRFWHNCVDLDTIFVDPNEPSRIIGMTGWDHSQIAPLFKQKIWPDFSEWAADMGMVEGDDEEE